MAAMKIYLNKLQEESKLKSRQAKLQESNLITTVDQTADTTTTGTTAATSKKRARSNTTASTSNKKIKLTESKRTEDLSFSLSSIRGIVNSTLTSPVKYLEDCLFQQILGELSFTVPKFWNKNPVFSCLKQRTKALNTWHNYTSISFLNTADKKNKFLLYVLFSHLTNCDTVDYNPVVFKGFEFKNKIGGKPKTAIEQIFASCIYSIFE